MSVGNAPLGSIEAADGRVIGGALGLFPVSPSSEVLAGVTHDNRGFWLWQHRWLRGHRRAAHTPPG